MKQFYYYIPTLCSNDRAYLISKYRRNQLDATNSDLLAINSISTSFEHLYAHHQEIQLRSTAYSFLSCCSCCDAGESGGEMCALCEECCLSDALPSLRLRGATPPSLHI